MTDILIDKTQGNKRFNLPRCYRCDHSRYPDGKTIFPDDKLAQKIGNEYVCGVCVVEQNTKLLSLFGRSKT